MFRMSVFVWLVSLNLGSTPAHAANRIEIESEGQVSVSMPPLATMSAARRRAFEMSFAKEFSSGTESIDGHRGDRVVTPIPLRGPIGNCAGSEIYVLDDSELRVKDSRGEIGVDVLAVGSAGMPLWIYASKPGSTKFERIFSESVQTFYGSIDHSDTKATCPNFAAEVHGSHFQRAGNLTGAIVIRFSQQRKKFEFLRGRS